MTDHLYYQNARLSEFNAHIISRRETDHGPAVLLDQTAFYPTSGGQPHDTGNINNIPVLDVWEEEDGEVWHLLKEQTDIDEVAGKIDWERRFDHMQQHTGQHLLSASFLQKMEANTIGFHLGSKESTVDLDIPSLTWEQAFEIESKINQKIWENIPVNVHIVDQQDIGAIPLRKPPQVSGKIRVIWIDGYDASACGGTHVSSSGEIGMVKITRIDRYKGGIRVAFLCGKRALRDYQHSLRSIQQVSADLSVHPAELGEALGRMQQELKDSRKQLKIARDKLVVIRADQMWENEVEVGGVRKVIAHLDGCSFDEARSIASLLQERPQTLVLLAVSDSKGVRLVCARSDGLEDFDSAAVLHRAAESLGGRGGGTDSIAQGGAPSNTHEVIQGALNGAVE